MNHLLFFLMLIYQMVLVHAWRRSGICYDPLHDMNLVHSQGFKRAFVRDFARIRREGFLSVRTFQTRFGGVPIAPYIANAGLKVNLGINTEASDKEQQIQDAIAAGRDPRNYVAYISVGNENLHHQSRVGDVIGIIHRLKHELPHIPIGTTQRPNEWLKSDHEFPRLNELVHASDYLGVNLYPFFSDLGRGKVKKVDMVRIQWWQVKNRHPSRKLVLGESGWPSQGGMNQYGNVASVSEAKQSYWEFNDKWFTNGYPGFHRSPQDMYYFQFYDQPYKKHSRFEAHFGLRTWDAQMKW